jgi:hypothetical protein
MSHINKLAKLPPKREKVETIEILRQLSKSSNSLGELKGIAKTIPNQEMSFCLYWSNESYSLFYLSVFLQIRFYV